MYNILPKKKDVLPTDAIHAEKLLSKMIKTRNFKVANDRLRHEVILKSNTDNLIHQRDRIQGHIYQTVMPALQHKLKKDLYGLNKEINKNIFNLHVLGKQENLI